MSHDKVDNRDNIERRGSQKKGKMMLRGLIGLILALFIVLHGYFYLSFGTFDPCSAATFKVINQGESEATRAGGLLFSAAIEKLIRSKGVLACYRIAITGEAPEKLF